MNYTFDWKKYADTARKMVSEGCVLLKNDRKALPIKSGETVSLFGRIMFDYIKSGTGSGGMVNAPYVVSILDALREDEDVKVNEDIISVYEEWVKDNPFDKGKGWAMEPWCQKEMPLSDDIVNKASKASDIAVVIIGRTAGEDRDNSATEGSYYLSKEEEEMMAMVTKHFSRVAVVLNVGNILDMKWVDKYNPSAVLYGWQGGCEGGHGVVDVLTGKVNPSGKLADTIAYNIEDYPSTAHFGDDDLNRYYEDIYVGYRYFETAAKEKVMYPFGFGMSYTTFESSSVLNLLDDNIIRVDSRVTNTGDMAGKEVIQVYYEAPQGALCQPARQLIAFAKTDTLFPKTDQTLSMSFKLEDLASYDDSGCTGHKDAYVLEAGEYVFYAGSDVRSAELVGSFTLGQTIVVKEAIEAATPVTPMNRMLLRKNENGIYEVMEEAVPTRSYDLMERIVSSRPESRPCTGNQGYTFTQVVTGEVTVEDFLDQLTDFELINLTRGEGMCSPKVTPGIAAAFGGVTKVLHEQYGIPVAGCSDGPSGIRMDCGATAFSLPNGTAQACSFNLDLISELYEYEGQELRKNKIDLLLGPGINIHRNPLNGRNFEYYSEDPFLTGSCAVAELASLHKYKVSGTCKHFATNNQEYRRHFVDAIVSGRALREIYLKAYKIAVEKGGAYSIMTTYGPLNGIYTAGNYDLATTILREEWGFDGLVMTDWWAKISEDDGSTANVKNTMAMIRSQNDIYMVTSDSEKNGNDDNAEDAVKDGRITRGELLRNAANIISVLKRTLATELMLEGDDEITIKNAPKGGEKIINNMPYTEISESTDYIDITGLKTEGGCDNVFTMHILDSGIYEMTIRMKSDAGELSQTTMTVSENGMLLGTFTINGTNGEWIEKKLNVDTSFQSDNYVNLYFAQTGIDIESISMKLVQRMTMLDKREAGVLA